MWILTLLDELIGSEALASAMSKNPRLLYLIKQYQALRDSSGSVKDKLSLKGLRASFKGREILNEIGNSNPKFKAEFMTALKEHNETKAKQGEAESIPYNQVFIDLWRNSSWISGGIYQATTRASNNQIFGDLTIWTQKGYGGYTYPNVNYHKTWLKMIAEYNVAFNGAGTRFWETYLHRHIAGKVKAPKTTKTKYSTTRNSKTIRTARKQNRKIMRARA